MADFLHCSPETTPTLLIDYESESEVGQSSPTLCAPVDCTPPCSSVRVNRLYPNTKRKKKFQKKKKERLRKCVLPTATQLEHYPRSFMPHPPHPNPLWLHFVPAETGSEQGPRSRGLPHLPLPQPCFPPSCTHAGIPGSTLVLISAASPLHLVADLSLRLGPPPLHLPVKSSSGPTS